MNTLTRYYAKVNNLLCFFKRKTSFCKGSANTCIGGKARYQNSFLSNLLIIIEVNTGITDLHMIEFAKKYR